MEVKREILVMIAGNKWSTDYETDAVSHYIVFLGVLSGIFRSVISLGRTPVMAVLLLVYLAAAYWIDRISRIEI